MAVNKTTYSPDVIVKKRFIQKISTNVSIIKFVQITNLPHLLALFGFYCAEWMVDLLYSPTVTLPI